MLQPSVQSATTQPLTQAEKVLSNQFNALFQNPRKWAELSAGAQAGHKAIIDNYEKHTLPGTTWITFTDMGKWDKTPQGYLNRSSITEFIQYGNNREAAAYCHSFLDENGSPLDGSSRAYLLTPGLVTNSDGSVSILMSATLPSGFPEANWLPVPKGEFNVMLRAYGSQGTVLDNTYVPPPLKVVPIP